MSTSTTQLIPPAAGIVAAGSSSASLVPTAHLHLPLPTPASSSSNPVNHPTPLSLIARPPLDVVPVALSAAGRLTTNSSLVETVSINYDDFTDTFLTCATCLCSYDQKERRPKLLACSHTVCQHCLQRIVDLPQTQDSGNFRCPICRESHQVPHQGVQAIPPSFLVNQLIDLMQRQRRDVVPKCNDHPAEELMFCETCDTVFCSMCKENDQSAVCHNHTIVPFSIAIKRMSEILLYKANQCVRNLNRAAENVAREQNLLDANVDRILDEVNASFQDLSRLLDDRRHELVNAVRRTRDEKRKVLQEQLSIIQAEKAKVEQQCSGLQYQVEVRSITRRIGDLNEKLDQTLTLVEPRENSFLRYDSSTEQVLLGIQQALGHFGTLSVSRTFPPLCTAAQSRAPACVHLLNHVQVITIDYNGQPRTTGGDPVEARLEAVHAKIIDNQSPARIGVLVTDNNDGTYDLAFRPNEPGEYRLLISIFGRAIRSSPLCVSVTEHHAPIWQFGQRQQLCQPVKVMCCARTGCLYVLDTGNSRVLRVDRDGKSCRCVIGSHCMLDGSAVGMALMPSTSHDVASGSAGNATTSASAVAVDDDESILTLNWRSKTVTEWSCRDGREIRSFTFSEFSEPIDVAVDRRARILVADQGAAKVFVFDSQAHPLFSFPVAEPTTVTEISSGKTSGKSPVVAKTGRRMNGLTGNRQQLVPAPAPITCLAVGVNDDILIGRGPTIQIYDNAGVWQRQIDVPQVCQLNGSHPQQQQQQPQQQQQQQPQQQQQQQQPQQQQPQQQQHQSPNHQRKSSSKWSSAVIGGLAIDRSTGVILSTVAADRQRTFVAICGYKGQLAYTMDSHGARLRRPSGICVSADGDECYVADLGNNAVKKYKFK